MNNISEQIAATIVNYFKINNDIYFDDIFKILIKNNIVQTSNIKISDVKREHILLYNNKLWRYYKKKDKTLYIYNILSPSKNMIYYRIPMSKISSQKSTQTSLFFGDEFNNEEIKLNYNNTEEKLENSINIDTIEVDHDVDIFDYNEETINHIDINKYVCCLKNGKNETMFCDFGPSTPVSLKKKKKIIEYKYKKYKLINHVNNHRGGNHVDNLRGGNHVNCNVQYVYHASSQPNIEEIDFCPYNLYGNWFMTGMPKEDIDNFSPLPIETIRYGPFIYKYKIKNEINNLIYIKDFEYFHFGSNRRYIESTNNKIARNTIANINDGNIIYIILHMMFFDCRINNGLFEIFNDVFIRPQESTLYKNYINLLDIKNNVFSKDVLPPVSNWEIFGIDGGAKDEIISAKMCFINSVKKSKYDHLKLNGWILQSLEYLMLCNPLIHLENEGLFVLDREMDSIIYNHSQKNPSYKFPLDKIKLFKLPTNIIDKSSKNVFYIDKENYNSFHDVFDHKLNDQKPYRSRFAKLDNDSQYKYEIFAKIFADIKPI